MPEYSNCDCKTPLQSSPSPGSESALRSFRPVAIVRRDESIARARDRRAPLKTLAGRDPRYRGFPAIIAPAPDFDAQQTFPEMIPARDCALGSIERLCEVFWFQVAGEKQGLFSLGGFGIPELGHLNEAPS